MWNIELNTVTWYSKILAGIVFVGVFVLGGYLGMEYQKAITPIPQVGTLEQYIHITADDIEYIPEEQLNNVQDAVFDFVGPNSGTRFCRGDKEKLYWYAAGEDVYAVRLILHDTRNAWPLGDFPTTHNEFGAPGSGQVIWTVGTYPIDPAPYNLVSDSNIYYISATALGHDGQPLDEGDSGTFSIQTCNNQ